MGRVVQRCLSFETPADWSIHPRVVAWGPSIGGLPPPDVVVQVDEKAPGQTLSALAARRLSDVRLRVDAFQLLDSSALTVEGHPAHRARFEWTADGRRVRQEVTWIEDRGTRVLSVTFSSLAVAADAWSPIFSRVISSLQFSK